MTVQFHVLVHNVIYFVFFQRGSGGFSCYCFLVLSQGSFHVFERDIVFTALRNAGQGLKVCMRFPLVLVVLLESMVNQKQSRRGTVWGAQTITRAQYPKTVAWQFSSSGLGVKLWEWSGRSQHQCANVLNRPIPKTVEGITFSQCKVPTLLLT